MNREKKNIFYQRKKGEPITYDGSAEPIPLSFVSQEWPNKLTLKINASPQDWNILHQLAEASPEYLGRLIFLNITRPINEKFLSREGKALPRGFHSEAQKILMEEARRYSAAAFAVLSHWAKQPLTTWLDELKAQIHEAEKLWGKENIWPPEKQSYENDRQSIDVITVVRYLLNIKDGIRRDELGLDNLEEMDNEIFRKIYLDKDKVEAAKAINDNFIQKYGDPLDIDRLHECVPGFGWELIKE
ncbi:MAG: hypothetical protein FJ135_15300 [Deltaproteobacteria bacterium]|nr:hypothetical protein [Deltaproteobacteria bacterium]